MDWTPRTDEEDSLYALVRRVAERFVTELDKEQVLFGVGVAPATDGVAPLILMNRALLPQLPGDYEPPMARMRSEVTPFRLDRLPESLDRGWRAADIAGRYDLPSSTQVLPVSRPGPLGARTIATGDALLGGATGMRGTVGVHVRTADGKDALLTAGHVAGTAAGAPVDHVRRRRFRKKMTMSRLGAVVFGCDPVEQPGEPAYDLAVVSYTAAPWARVTRARPANLSAYIQSPEPAELIGALSGRIHGGLIGALYAYGDGERLWKNSWTMVPSHMAVQGDSGGPVLTRDRQCVGMLVGGSTWPYSTAMEVQYVQAAESAYREVLAPQGISFG